MAFVHLQSFFTGFILLSLHFQLSYSLICSTQTFLNKKSFDACIDLPYHNAQLHWTYNQLNSSLSMAYVAPLPSPDGWVAWAINNMGSGMLGSQALIAFKQQDGSVAAKTYDIQSYVEVEEGPLSINVTGIEAEYSGGKMMIFSTWVLPERPESVNQVWQVGSYVINEKPDRHDFERANLASMGRLNLVENVQSEEALGSGTKAAGGPRSVDPAPAPVSESSGAGESLMMRIVHYMVNGIMVVVACIFFF